MSTYSPSLRIELITTGDQAGTWGTTTNSNLGTLIESAIAGYTSVSITSADQALTALNGAADQSRNMVIALTTTTTANFNVYAPPAEKTYTIYNASAYTATIYNSTVIGNTTAAGAGVAIPAGKTMNIWSEGTNFYFQNTHTVGSINATSGAFSENLTAGAGFRENKISVGASNIDLNLGSYFSKTISGATSFTVSNVPPNGTGVSFILDLTNGGSAAVTWWPNVRWPYGSAPALTVSGRDVLGFFTYDGGANWNGVLVAGDIR